MINSFKKILKKISGDQKRSTNYEIEIAKDKEKLMEQDQGD